MRLALRSDVSATDGDLDMVLLHECTGRYWYLNATGAFILRLFLNGSERTEIARSMADRFPVSVEEASEDIEKLVSSLCTADLVRVKA
ncbi:lasso peptide biosynthesis PqqD family chaperone [Streptomyces roseolus]|uniref:lasso peptide biosynthesis PqqD family chaperone n=1 Tax=Streptomyces roseolus TaxID=67358 RepID=UPI0036541509